MDKETILKEYIKYLVKKTILEKQGPQIDPERIGKVEEYTKSLPLLDKALRILMSDKYRHFIKDIQIISPKPSTYKVTFNNDYFMYLKYNRGSVTAEIEGKKYALTAVEEAQRASNSITNILKFSNANIIKDDAEDDNELSDVEGGGFGSGGIGADPGLEGGEEGEEGEDEEMPANDGSEVGGTENPSDFDVDKILGVTK